MQQAESERARMTKGRKENKMSIKRAENTGLQMFKIVRTRISY